MTARRLRTQKDDGPKLWEPRPISRERWERHREQMLAQSFAGHRPPEWWLYEKGLDVPRPREEPVLFQMGELDPAEIAELMPMWRQHFQRSLEPGFAYCRGAGNWLKGKAARRALYEWAGIPAPILERLKAEASGSGDGG
jgi:hypothetical protein